MKFYYTTSAGTDQAQTKIINSIGGYKSSTPVPNSRLNSLFGDISTYTIQNDNDQYIALYLTNETGGDITGLTLYFSYPENCYTKMEVGAVTPGTDSVGEEYIERLQDFYSAPYNVTFYEASGVGNKVALGDLTSGSSFGIFIKRSLLSDVISDDYSDNFITANGDEYVQNDLGTSDEIDIVLEWS